MGSEIDLKKNENHYTYEGEDCIYTDPATGFQVKYQWNKEENKWVVKPSAANEHKYEKFGDTYTYKDETTDKILIWDPVGKEWKDKETTRPKKKRERKNLILRKKVTTRICSNSGKLRSVITLKSTATG